MADEREEEEEKVVFRKKRPAPPPSQVAQLEPMSGERGVFLFLSARLTVTDQSSHYLLLVSTVYVCIVNLKKRYVHATATLKCCPVSCHNCHISIALTRKMEN